ncbi:MAG: FHA domain-containing protein [Verrucomicrobiaceae bacterium]|nr:FHA domain-containing protein [Verrucomicrobiaceae bacterium]
MAALVIYSEDDSIQTYRIENDLTTIGRHPESDIVLDSASASGRHASIKKSGSNCFVNDLGSSNGTRVNGADVEEALLRNGDRVSFGDVQCLYYTGEPPSSAELKKAVAPATAVPVPANNAPLPAPTVMAAEKPSELPRASARPALSPVRRAYSRNAPSDYPDDAGGGCMNAAIVIGLFIVAFIVGLSLRHSREMNGNFINDFMAKLTEKVPTVKFERKEDEKKGEAKDSDGEMK